MKSSESQTLGSDETYDTEVSDLRKWVCGDPFSERGNNYEETTLGKKLKSAAVYLVTVLRCL